MRLPAGMSAQAGRKHPDASSMVSRAAAEMSSAGTHSGNGTAIARWAPDAVWTSSTAASRSAGNRSASRTTAGHTRRWIRVTLPLIKRVATTSPEASRSSSTLKISWPAGCPHQLPRIRSPRPAQPDSAPGRARTAARRPARAASPAPPSGHSNTGPRPWVWAPERGRAATNHGSARAAKAARIPCCGSSCCPGGSSGGDDRRRWRPPAWRTLGRTTITDRTPQPLRQPVRVQDRPRPDEETLSCP